MVRFSAVLGVLLAAAPVFAHHSIMATYDPKQPVTIKGVVVSFEYRNPHSYVHVEAQDEQAAAWSGGRSRLARWRCSRAAAGRGTP